MWTEDKLDALLSQPSEALIEDIKALSGDIIPVSYTHLTLPTNA